MIDKTISNVALNFWQIYLSVRLMNMENICIGSAGCMLLIILCTVC